MKFFPDLIDRSEAQFDSPKHNEIFPDLFQERLNAQWSCYGSRALKNSKASGQPSASGETLFFQDSRLEIAAD